MRTNFPPTGPAPSARDSLRRALLLSALMVVVWTAIAFLPNAESPETGAVASTPTEQVEPPSAGPEASADAIEIPEEGQSVLDSGTSLLPSGDRSLFRPGYIFAMILLAVAGTGAFYLRKRRDPLGPHGSLQEIGSFRLGPQQQVRLVRCADEVLLLGVTGGSVNLLKAYPASQFPTENPSQAASPAPSWTTSISRAARALASPAPSGPQEEAAKNSEVSEEDMPEWTIATASAISDGPDFMHVLRRYTGKKTYKANTLHPPTGATN